MSNIRYKNSGDDFSNNKRQIITTQEIEDVKSKILELFWVQKQSNETTKQLFKTKLNSVLEKLDSVLKSID